MIKIPDNILSELCGKFGVSAGKLRYLGGGREDSDGTAYTYQKDEKTYVLKILAIPKKEVDGTRRLEERIKFAGFLGENGIDLAYPKVNSNGNLYEALSTDNHVFTGYKMDMREGRHTSPEEWTPDFYHTWGRVTGKLHRITKLYPHWINIPGSKDTVLNGWQDELHMFYDWCKDSEVKQKWLEMETRLATLPLNRDTFGFIHNDNHTNNVLWNGNNITILDFDVANCHFFINDIAVALQGLLFSAAGGMISPVADYNAIKRAVTNFMTGYEQENHLDDFWLTQIDTFVNYRRLLLFTVMQDWLDTNVELKQKFRCSIENEPAIYEI